MVPEELSAVESIRQYVNMRREKPLRNVCDSIHGVHLGTEWEAELKLSDLMIMLLQHDATIALLNELLDSFEDHPLNRGIWVGKNFSKADLRVGLVKALQQLA